MATKRNFSKEHSFNVVPFFKEFLALDSINFLHLNVENKNNISLQTSKSYHKEKFANTSHLQIHLHTLL